MLIFAGVVLVLCVVVLAFGIKIISQTDIAIVERLGRFHRVLDGGFHFIIPIIDRLSAVVSAREQMIDIGRQQVITKDNVNINIDGIVFLKVFDAKSAV